MERDGNLFIGPDSGDLSDILCGDPNAPVGSPAYKGVVELLWDIFRGSITETGHKLLDSHIGVIYGDAINFERAQDILARLEAKGFASANVVFGMGSYGYQYQTRDTFGFAMKATNVVINGVEKPIFKDPVTDNGTKKSLKGRLGVYWKNNIEGGSLVALDEITDQEQLDASLLTTVWKDGKFVKRYTFDEVRANARA